MTHDYGWICPASMTTDLEAGSKEDIIDQLLELVRLTGKVTDAAALEDAIIRREEMASTEIDDGIDVPHALTSGVSEFCVAVGTERHKKLYMLIAWNESNARNLRLLAFLLETVKKEKERLLAAETNDQMYRIIASALEQADLT